jgi:hypothetical protein
MSPEYLKSVIQQPYRILGLTLHPLSLGHIVLMEFLGVDDQKLTAEMLINGCLVCSMRFREFIDFMSAPDRDKRLRKMGRQFRFEDVNEKALIFKEYLRDGLETPETEMPNSMMSEMTIGSPWIQIIRVRLMSKLGISSEAVWDYPYRLALWDCFSMAESEGRLSILTGDLLEERGDRHDTLSEMNAQLLAQHPELRAELEGK